MSGPFQLRDDVYTARARHIARKYFRKVYGSEPPRQLPLPPIMKRRAAVGATATDAPGTIGILGAGAGGLYAAMILDDLCIPYQIIEAQDHVGGRLFTYKFKEDPNGDGFNYYDVGAMRFPNTNAMRRVFHLFDSGKINIKTQPYIYQSPAQLYSYNGFTYQQKNTPLPPADAFNSRAVIDDVNSTPYLNVGPDAIIADVINPFAARIKSDLDTGSDEGWRYLEQFSNYSMRAYMSIKYIPSPSLGLPPTPLSNDVVNWCETFGGSTGSYDRAFAEAVLDEIAFGWPDSTIVDWRCIDGGAQQIANGMRDYLISQKGSDIFTYNTRIRTISMANANTAIHVAGDSGYTNTFDHVISTIPLPVMRTIDLTEAGLSPMQSNALRQLTYGEAVKIGIQFKSAWWTTATNNKGVPLDIVGGQSYTDSMLRKVIYPSFGDVGQGKTTTLIATYCWDQDAARYGALINAGDDQWLQEFTLKELARLHNLEFSFLKDQFMEMHAWSWYHDPLTMGAYAFFGPGMFENLYQSLNTYAGNGHLHFAGEALSARHAWVEGAFDSAWRAIAEILVMPGWEQYQAKFIQDWGANPEWIDPTAAKSNDHSAIFHPEKSLLIRHLAATHGED